jgi:hypothetical protein
MRHTPDGQFTLTIGAVPGRARIELSTTSTGPWHPDPDRGCPDDQDDRWLTVIDALADSWGHYGDPSGQTMWAEVRWSAADHG